jgi:hypothetical protein
MKVKTYEIKNLVANDLQLKIFSHKRLVTKIFIPYVLGFILIFKSI